jgi:hypothetical protein
LTKESTDNSSIQAERTDVRQNVDKSLNAYCLRVCEGQTFRKGVAGLHSLFTRYKDSEHPITFNVEPVFRG